MRRVNTARSRSTRWCEEITYDNIMTISRIQLFSLFFATHIFSLIIHPKTRKRQTTQRVADGWWCFSLDSKQPSIPTFQVLRYFAPYSLSPSRRNEVSSKADAELLVRAAASRFVSRVVHAAAVKERFIYEFLRLLTYRHNVMFAVH